MRCIGRWELRGGGDCLEDEGRVLYRYEGDYTTRYNYTKTGQLGRISYRD